MTKFIEVVFDNKRLELPKGSRLLELNRDNPDTIPFRCRQGICGTCRIHILNGMKNVSVIQGEEYKFLGS